MTKQDEQIQALRRAFRALKDLHNCESVQCSGEPCPICAAWEILEDVNDALP